MVLQQLAERVSDRARGEYGFTIPWEMIMELIMELISNADCFNSPQDFLDSAASPTLGQRIGLKIITRRTLGLRRRRDVLAVQGALLSCAAECNQGELLSAFNETNAILNFGSGPNSDAPDTDV